LPLQRDELLSTIEYEDFCALDIFKDGWKSSFAKEMKKSSRYSNPKHQQEIYNAYYQEAIFRNARAEHFREVQNMVPNISNHDLELQMNQWDLQHVNEGACCVWSPFRDTATKALQKRAEQEASTYNSNDQIQAESSCTNEKSIVTGETTVTKDVPAKAVVTKGVLATRENCIIEETPIFKDATASRRPTTTFKPLPTGLTTKQNVSTNPLQTPVMLSEKAKNIKQYESPEGSKAHESENIKKQASQTANELQWEDLIIQKLRQEASRLSKEQQDLQSQNIRLKIQLSERITRSARVNLLEKYDLVDLDVDEFTHPIDLEYARSRRDACGPVVLDMEDCLELIDDSAENFIQINEKGARILNTAKFEYSFDKLYKSILESLFQLHSSSKEKSTVDHVCAIMDALEGTTLYWFIVNELAELVEEVGPKNMPEIYEKTLVTAKRFDTAMNAFDIPMAHPQLHCNYCDKKKLRICASLLRHQVGLMHKVMTLFSQNYPQDEPKIYHTYEPRDFGMTFEELAVFTLQTAYGINDGSPEECMDVYTLKKWKHLKQVAKAIDQISADMPASAIISSMPVDQVASEGSAMTMLAKQPLERQLAIFYHLQTAGTHPVTTKLLNVLFTENVCEKAVSILEEHLKQSKNKGQKVESLDADKIQHYAVIYVKTTLMKAKAAGEIPENVEVTFIDANDLVGEKGSSNKVQLRITKEPRREFPPVVTIQGRDAAKCTKLSDFNVRANMVAEASKFDPEVFWTSSDAPYDHRFTSDPIIRDDVGIWSIEM